VCLVRRGQPDPIALQLAGDEAGVRDLIARHQTHAEAA
jgi:hypothetical protein